MWNKARQVGYETCVRRGRQRQADLQGCWGHFRGNALSDDFTQLFLLFSFSHFEAWLEASLHVNSHKLVHLWKCKTRVESADKGACQLVNNEAPAGGHWKSWEAYSSVMLLTSCVWLTKLHNHKTDGLVVVVTLSPKVGVGQIRHRKQVWFKGYVWQAFHRGIFNIQKNRHIFYKLSACYLNTSYWPDWSILLCIWECLTWQPDF